MTDKRGFYTVLETADHFRVSYKTIFRMIHSGKIPAFKIGSQWRISGEYLQSASGSTGAVTTDSWRDSGRSLGEPKKGFTQQ
tara:strand:+ start:67 stop:312 length:246 start_codon:yes stop_codon:yes gene_type:complete